MESSDYTWGLLIQIIAGYKREGRVVTKKSFVKEIQAYFNCQCCMKERHENIRKKVEAGMTMTKDPDGRDKDMNLLLAILNGSIVDTITMEELKDVEKMIDRALEKIYQDVQKEVLRKDISQ